MMARTKPIRRSYGAGEWGRNRVRVFPDPKTGLFQIEWRENGRRLTRSLKHRDWRRAKRQADEFAAGYLGPELHRKAEAESEPLTLERLFDIYGEEVTPTKRGQSRLHDRAATRMFLGCFGRDRDPATLSQRDWDRTPRVRVMMNIHKQLPLSFPGSPPSPDPSPHFTQISRHYPKSPAITVRENESLAITPGFRPHYKVVVVFLMPALSLTPTGE